MAIPGTGLHRLSLEQELWWWHLRQAGPRAVNVPLELRLLGRLDPALVERAMNVVVGRHVALRSVFLAAADGTPCQRFLDSVEVPLPLVDLGQGPQAEREARACALIREQLLEQFDMTRPPWRQRLYRLGPEDHVWFTSFNSMVADSASRDIIARELLGAYAALRDGREPALPPPAADYLDVLGRQRAWLGTDEADQMLSAWREDLAGAAAHSIAGDRARPPARSFRGTRREYDLRPTAVRALAALCEREGVTLYMCLLAVVAALLGRYTGNSDVVVITVMSTRGHAATHDLPGAGDHVGVFVNPVPVRCRWSGDVTFRELLHEARTRTLAMQSRKDVPVLRVLRATGWEGDQIPALISQYEFAFVETPVPAAGVPGLDVQPFDFGCVKSQVDLGPFFVGSPREGLVCVVEYDTDLFDGTTIDRFWRHLEVVMERVVDSPGQRLSELLAGIGELSGVTAG
jgi:hypothetical protein